MQLDPKRLEAACEAGDEHCRHTALPPRLAYAAAISAYLEAPSPSQAGEPFGWARKHVKDCNPAYHFTRDKRTAAKWENNGEFPVALYVSPQPAKGREGGGL